MKLLITRPLPTPVIDAARAVFDVDVREETSNLSADELRASLRDYDVVLPTLGDAYSADVFADVVAPRVKMLANFGVGFNHIDVDVARDGNRCEQYTRRCDRCDRRYRDDFDADERAASGRR